MSIAPVLDLWNKIPSDPFAAGHQRLKRSGLVVAVSPMRADESQFPVDVICMRARPRRTAFREWRDYYEPRARKIVACHRVLVASATHDGQRLALGFLMLTDADVVRRIYVKLPHRGHGIGLRLLEDAGVSIPVAVVDPEPGWKRWAAYHGLPWEVRT